MRRGFAGVGALGALAALAAAALGGAHIAAAQTTGPGGELRVGVVDLAGIFKGYRKRAVLEERINAERDQLKGELDELKKRVSDLNKEMDLLDRNSASWRQKSEEKDRLLIEYEIKKRWLEQRIKERWEEYNLALIADIEAAVRQYGSERGYDLLLNVADPSEEQKLLVGVKSVMYFSSRVDVTAQVVELLNRRWELEGGAAPELAPAAGAGGPGKGGR
ncbi:MAG: hypothetical protein KatS3mg102_0530 [Planctomycetota bacterium]|nr:MAG: hypothetical protein KatS3mg102_0530 [Planctomycetota bacterium]